MKTVYVGEVDPGGAPPARIHDLADWWPLPPSAGGTLTKEEYDRGERLGRQASDRCSPSTGTESRAAVRLVDGEERLL
jgi:hypothetical protein